MNNYIGEECFCVVCEDFYIMTDDLLVGVELQHESGEELSITKRNVLIVRVCLYLKA